MKSRHARVGNFGPFDVQRFKPRQFCQLLNALVGDQRRFSMINEPQRRIFGQFARLASSTCDRPTRKSSSCSRPTERHQASAGKIRRREIQRVQARPLRATSFSPSSVIVVSPRTTV